MSVPTDNSPESTSDPAAPRSTGQRREFLKKSFALALGGGTIAVPVCAGLAVCLDPLRGEKGVASFFVRVTTLDALPADGIPRRFPILTSRRNAWNKVPAASIGAVYLRRTPDGALQAVNAACPHAGCIVDYEPARRGYLCPCHKSVFTVEGKLADPNNQAQRPLDELSVEVRDERDVWIHFQNFFPGSAEKMPVT